MHIGQMENRNSAQSASRSGWYDLLPTDTALAQESWELRHRIRIAIENGASHEEIATFLNLSLSQIDLLVRHAKEDVAKKQRSPAGIYINTPSSVPMLLSAEKPTRIASKPQQAIILFNAGKSIEDIAKFFRVRPSTVRRYLTQGGLL